MADLRERSPTRQDHGHDTLHSISLDAGTLQRTCSEHFTLGAAVLGALTLGIMVSVW